MKNSGLINSSGYGYADEIPKKAQSLYKINL